MKHLEETPWFICDKEDENYCAYVDTDSNYFNAEPILKYLYPNFEELSDKDKDDKFIPIGHSIGSWFALHFSNLYSSRCLKVIFLEGAYIDSNHNDFKRIKNNKIKANNIDLLVNRLFKIKKHPRHIRPNRIQTASSHFLSSNDSHPDNHPNR